MGSSATRNRTIVLVSGRLLPVFQDCTSQPCLSSALGTLRLTLPAYALSEPAAIPHRSHHAVSLHSNRRHWPWASRIPLGIVTAPSSWSDRCKSSSYSPYLLITLLLWIVLFLTCCQLQRFQLNGGLQAYSNTHGKKGERPPPRTIRNTRNAWSHIRNRAMERLHRDQCLREGDRPPRWQQPMAAVKMEEVSAGHSPWRRTCGDKRGEKRIPWPVSCQPGQ